ncbi:MAG: Gfo/Idh/MocA family oxidoreductase [Planctomycetaceae bacterium]|nr:Gfo/Idh/MocA family oxidoreductase [Planctomycetaceae bacterium]
MSEKVCRWGILSTAGIAQKNWHSIANSGNGQVVAVASRSIEKAQRFIDECSASVPVPQDVKAYGSYEDLLADPGIDAVYVPLPTGLRAEWVIRAADAGKHVMVEKPCGVAAENLRTMIDACERNQVQFMDGVMFMHSDRMAAMREALDDGRSVGTIRRIASQFSFCAPDEWVASNIRATSSLEPAGCLGDLGWYTIRFTLWVMKYEMPTEVRGRILHGTKRSDSPEEVPMEFQGELHFASGVSATFYNSFRTENQQWVNVSGTQGYLHVEDFVLPQFGSEVSFTTSSHKFVVDGCRFNMEGHTKRTAVREYSNNMPQAQEANLFRNFASLVLSGKRDNHWPEIALKTQLVMDAALNSARNGGMAVAPEI